MDKNWLLIMKKLLLLTGSLFPVLLITVALGTLGFLCAIFLVVFGGYGILHILSQAVTYKMGYCIGGILLFALFRGVLRYGEQLSGHYIAFRLLALLRDKIFAALRKLAPAKLEGREKGGLIAVITSDVELLEVFYAHTIAPILIAVITSAIMTAFIAAQHVLLGLIAFLGYCMVGIVIPVINSKKGKKQGSGYREAFSEANVYFLDSLRGLKEILRYGQQEVRRSEIKNITESLDQKQEKLKQREGLTRAATEAAILCFSITIFLTGAFLMQKGDVSFHGVFIATVAMMSSFGPVSAISSLSNNLLQTMASGERVLGLLEEEPEITEVSVGADVDFKGASCCKVGFAYEEEKILDRVDIDFEENQIIGIEGKSGSGKSTLLKLLMRFWDTKEGRIIVSGKDIRDINTKALQRMESYVTQDTFLFQESLEDNIKIACPSATRQQVEEAAKQAGIHEFILTLPEGYETNAGKFGESLSSGERQRIGVARAFLHGSPFILLDEPTSNLDSLNEAFILKSLKEQKKGKTIVLVSHRESTMAIADKIYRMESGRVS